MFYKPGQARTSSFNFGKNVAAWEGAQPGIVFASNDKENTYKEVEATDHGTDSNSTEFQAGTGTQIKSKRRNRDWDNGVTTSRSNISPPRQRRRLNNHNDLNLMSQEPKKPSISMTEMCTKNGPFMRRTNGYKSKINILAKGDHTICSITPPLSGQKPAGNQSSLSLRELQKQILSEELQILLHKVTHIIKFSLDLSEVSKALYGIQTLRGIQELVPFLSRFVATGLTSKRNLLNTSLCRRLVQLVDAMLDNPNLDLELHIHQILTPLGTCVVAKRLSYSPNDNHWSLRDEAAQCISKICHIYGHKYVSMKSCIVKVFNQALETNRPITTQYGGIVGLSLFGLHVIEKFLLPLEGRYEEYGDRELASSAEIHQGNGDECTKYDLLKCQMALKDAFEILNKNATVKDRPEASDTSDSTSIVDC